MTKARFLLSREKYVKRNLINLNCYVRHFVKFHGICRLLNVYREFSGISQGKINAISHRSWTFVLQSHFCHNLKIFLDFESQSIELVNCKYFRKFSCLEVWLCLWQFYWSSIFPWRWTCRDALQQLLYLWCNTRLLKWRLALGAGMITNTLVTGHQTLVTS